MFDFEYDALVAEAARQSEARRPSPADMPKVRITPDMLATRLAWTTVTGDVRKEVKCD